MEEVTLIPVEEKEGYASVVLADLMEKKKQEHLSKLEELEKEWKSVLTKDYIEDKISGALLKGRNCVSFFNNDDNIENFLQDCSVDERKELLQKLDNHIHEIVHIKGMKLSYCLTPYGYVYHGNLFIEWDRQPSCTCNLQ